MEFRKNVNDKNKNTQRYLNEQSMSGAEELLKRTPKPKQNVTDTKSNNAK